MPTRNLQEAQRIARRTWESFVTGAEADLQYLSDSIRASWCRSRRQGSDPNLTRAPMKRLPTRSLHDAPAVARQPWLPNATAACRYLRSALSEPHQLILLTDLSGRVLLADAGEKARPRAEELNVVVGADWSEKTVGCTAIGACLHDGVPVLAGWYESYSCHWHDWINQAIPIRDPATKIVIGGLNVGGFREIVHPSVLEIMASTEEIIEASIASDDWRTRAQILEQYYRVASTHPNDACLALDRRGRVIALNAQAQHQYHLSDSVRGQAIDQIQTLSELFDITASADDGFSRRAKLKLDHAVEMVADQNGSAIFLVPGQHRARPTHAWPTRYTFTDLIGQSPAFQSCVKSARRAAREEWPVLILGESGTGKELLAQAIHANGLRRKGPFVGFSCAGVSDDLIAAELFGYRAGSFTGASKEGQIGKIEAADGGTLFLDDVECMPPRMQASLLRVLEDCLVLSVGSTTPKKVDVRIIAATNSDLVTACNGSLFRHDLYHRLNVINIQSPPLRERENDLAHIASHLLRQLAPGRSLSDKALESLYTYSWPGNVRELRNVLVRAIMETEGSMILQLTLPREKPIVRRNDNASMNVASFLTQAQKREKEELEHALANSANISEAAALLGIHFTSAYRRMRKYGLRKSSRFTAG